MKNTRKDKSAAAWGYVMLMIIASLLISLAAMTFGWVNHQSIIYFLLSLGAVIVVACGILLTSNGGQPPSPKKKLKSKNRTIKLNKI